MNMLTSWKSWFLAEGVFFISQSTSACKHLADVAQQRGMTQCKSIIHLFVENRQPAGWGSMKTIL